MICHDGLKCQMQDKKNCEHACTRRVQAPTVVLLNSFSELVATIGRKHELEMKRPPNDRGQGRKPLDPAGELMKTRNVRMTDAQWESCKVLGGSGWIRVQIKAALRKEMRSPPPMKEAE